MNWNDEKSKTSPALERSPAPRGGFLTRLAYELFWKRGNRREVWWTDYALAVGFCLGAAIVSSLLLFALGVRSGAGGKESLGLLRESPALFFFIGVCLAPILEELVFRVLPRVVASYWVPGDRIHWVLGCAVAIVFAFVHLTPSDDSIPAPQFFAGLSFWFVQWKYGYFGAVAVHATYNAIVLLLAYAALAAS